MVRLLRIALLSLLLIGVPFQGAWAGAFQCSDTQDARQMAQFDEPSSRASVLHEHDRPLDAPDCDKSLTAACAAMALPPSQSSEVAEPGRSDLVSASAVAATLFLTDGPDRPPRPRFN